MRVGVRWREGERAIQGYTGETEKDVDVVRRSTEEEWTGMGERRERRRERGEGGGERGGERGGREGEREAYRELGSSVLRAKTDD